MKKVTLGGGCFWCLEAVFQRINGITNVVSGYAGGFIPNPSYEEVCQGQTGHAEVIQFDYDPDIISFKEILEIFWNIHDPTTKNRQGADVGTQYRSVVLCHDEVQLQEALTTKVEMDNSGLYDAPIVTEITPLEAFYKAENHHQNYYNLNQSQPYCSMVIQPKLKKLLKLYSKNLNE